MDLESGSWTLLSEASKKVFPFVFMVLLDSFGVCIYVYFFDAAWCEIRLQTENTC